jgi:hypothetical protein
MAQDGKGNRLGEKRGIEMTKLANVRIGRKVGMLQRVSVLMVVCLAALALWSLHAVRAATR